MIDEKGTRVLVREEKRMQGKWRKRKEMHGAEMVKKEQERKRNVCKWREDVSGKEEREKKGKDVREIKEGKGGTREGMT